MNGFSRSSEIPGSVLQARPQPVLIVAPGQGRLFYMDAARAILMFIGIPYHTALAYSYFTDWTVKSPDLSYAASWFAGFSHAFRMPAFFIIAGFFSCLLLRKRGRWPWLRSRLSRLIAPLLTVGLLINPFVMLAEAANKAPTQVIAYWTGQLTTIGSHWVAQLWFLGDLLLFSSMLACLAALAPLPILQPVRRWIDQLTLDNWLRNITLIGTLGLYVVCAAIVVKLAGLSNFANGLIYPSRTFAQLPFFFVGVALALSPGLLADFTKLRGWLVAPAIASCITFAAVDYRPDVPSTLLAFFITPCVGLLSAQVIFSCARRWLNRPSKWVTAGVESSMVVYLTHILFVVWLVNIFRAVALPPLLEIAMIVSVAGGLSLLVHQIVRRSAVLHCGLHGYAPSLPQLDGQTARFDARSALLLTHFVTGQCKRRRTD